MDLLTCRAARMRAHLLDVPAASVLAAARHQTATQAQEFWGGRWALAVRTAGEPGLGEVDAAFETGALVRSWTQRGTLHIVAAHDLPWILEATQERQTRQYAGVLRNWGIDGGDVTRAERVTRLALRGGERLTRAEFTAALAAAGIDVERSRAQHFMTVLAIRRVLALGPVVPRVGAPTREQYLVGFEDAVSDAPKTADPVAELFVRYVASHGPASVADFAWWSGLALGAARKAREAADARVVEVEEGLFAACAAAAPVETAAPTETAVPVETATPVEAAVSAKAAVPVEAAVPETAASVETAVSGETAVPAEASPRAGTAMLALPAFDEYYISYRDRGVACAPAHAARVGPTANGLVRPVLVRGGEVVGLWSHSMAQGRHHLPPVAEPFRRLPAGAVRAALDRVHRFVTAL